MTAPRRTTWGVLSLIENPPRPDVVNPESSHRPISDKVPRSIALHGESTFVGRVKKGPQMMPQTQIFLPYISSSHCCFLLRRRPDDGAIEAVVKDTSSNGTFVNGAKLGKRNVSTLKAGDEIALYQPQGPTPLGMPIVYRLELHEQRFPQAIDERTEKGSEKQAGASATPARRVGGTDPGVGLSRVPATAKASGNGGNGARAPPSAGAGVASSPSGDGAGAGTGAPVSPVGSNRNVFSIMDDQNAIRKAAEAEAQRRVQVEREGLLRQIRAQSARLEESNVNHQELLSKNNDLQEQLAEADSSGRREQERAAHLQDVEHKLKATVQEMESQRRAAVAEAAQQRSAAEATNRAAAEARAEFETAKSDLQAQVNGLVEKNGRHESRMADLVQNKLALEKEVGGLRVQVAEVMGTRSGLEAQLKEARASEQDVRARLTTREQAFGELRQDKAEVEGKLAQRDRELKASEDSRELLKMCSEEARKLSLELSEVQAALCRATEELEQTRSRLDEEMVAREAAEAGAADLKTHVAELSSENQRIQKLFEKARKDGQETREQVEAVREQLKQTRKAHRVCQSQLLETRNELERVKNRKEGVAVEALMRGRNLKKAKRVVHEISKSLNEQLVVLLGHLEVPGEGVVLDSQGGLGGGSEIGDCIIDGDESDILDGDNGDSGRREGFPRVSGPGGIGSPLAADHAREEEEEGDQFSSTQMSPSAAQVEGPPGSPSAGTPRSIAVFPRIESEGVVRSGETPEAEDADDDEAQGGEEDDLTEDEEVHGTQDEGQEGEVPQQARTAEAKGAQMMEQVDDIEMAEEGKHRKGATEEVDAVCDMIHKSNVDDVNHGNESSIIITDSTATSSSKPPTMATLAKTAVNLNAEVATEVAVEAETEFGDDNPGEVKQRLEEDLESQEEEKGVEDGETEFTVPALNFSRVAEVPEARVSRPLGERGDDRSEGGGVARDASDFVRVCRSSQDDNMSEDDGGAGVAKKETEEHAKVEMQRTVEEDVEAAGFQVASSPKSVGGGGRKRGRQEDDLYDEPMDHPGRAKAVGARLDGKKPKAASERSGDGGGSHDSENSPFRTSEAEAMNEDDREIPEYDDGAGAVDPTQYDVSKEDVGRGKVAAAECDPVEKSSAANEAEIDGKRQDVPGCANVADDRGYESRGGNEEENEDEDENSAASSARGAGGSAPKRLGGQDGAAIDLSQDDSDETGDDEYY